MSILVSIAVTAFLLYAIYLSVAISNYFFWKKYDVEFKASCRFGTGGFPFGMQKWMKRLFK